MIGSERENAEGWLVKRRIVPATDGTWDLVDDTRQPDDPGVPSFLQASDKAASDFWQSEAVGPVPRIHKGAWLAAGAVLAVIVIGIWGVWGG